MIRRSLIISLLFLICSLDLFAQDTLVHTSSKLEFLREIDDRNWRIKLPLWVPGFRGEFAYGNITLLPETGKGDWVDRLEGELGITFYFIGDIMFKPKKWLFAADGFHTTLASDLGFEGVDKVEFPGAIDGTILRGYAGYQVFERQNKDSFFKTEIFPYVGVRYIDLDVYSEDSELINITPSWAEPIVGVNAFLNSKRWFFSGMIDVGGFSIDNHWSVFANADASYRFSKLFALGLGWSYLKFNYDQFYDRTYLDLQIALTGPVLNVEFHF